MSERQVVVLAVVTMAGAWRALAIPPVVVAAVVTAAVLAQRAPVVWLAAAMAASVLGARSWAGVEHAPTTGRIQAPATVVADPVRVPGGVRLELRLHDSGRRVQATASGDAGALLGSRLAGERVRVEGRLAAIKVGRDYLARRHIGSRLVVSAADDPRPGGPVSRFANQLRRTLVAGSDSMSAPRRALFTGLVIGDDRDQDPIEVDDFRASGLTHLLAVSGQNVAFVLAIAAPLLGRLGLRGRLAIGAGVLGTFGVLTRWEPSVLRAVAMAVLAMVAAASGRPLSSIRLLALAVTALVLVDPMLAGSIGFLLSVGACAGIAVVGPRLARLGIPQALAVTAAAQVGVAPVLIPAFGEVPLASLPANLLAGPAAGPVMVWGLVGGLPAGLLGGDAAWVLHLPTRALLAWIAGVARLAASLPLPQVDARGALVLSAIVGVWLALRSRPRSIAVAAVAALVATTVLATAGRRPPPAPDIEIAPGVELWRGGGAAVVVLAGNADIRRTVEALRSKGVRRVDVLVLRSGGSGAARLADAVDRRARVRLVLAPQGHAVPGARTATAGEQVRVGGLAIVVDSARARLEVRVASPSHAPRPRAPPLRRHHTKPGHGHPEPHDRLVLRQGQVLRPRRHARPGRPARCRRR